MAGKVRILKEKLFKFNEEDTKLSYVEGACDDDATPPQGNFVTGSAFENVTSGNKYKYSETSGDWVLQPSEGGGTGGGALIVHDNDGTLDKTWQEIYDASLSSVIVIATVHETSRLFVYCSSIGDVDGYYVGIPLSDGEVYYVAETADGYPVFEVS